MMRTIPHTKSRHVIQAALAICAAVFFIAFFFPLFVNRLPLVPPWTAAEAKRQAPRLRVGMTDTQVWSTLGLTGRGLRAHVEGSGPPERYPASYVLWPGYVLHTRWNLKTHPATLAEFKFQDRL